MSDPSKVSFEIVRGFYRELGLDESRFDDTRSVLIEAGRIVVTRYRLNEDGKKFMGGDQDMALETITIDARERQ